MRPFSVVFFVLITTLVAQEPPEIIALTSTSGDFRPVFESSALTVELRQKLQGSTWHEGCPVEPRNLRELKLSYWDFGGRPANGTLVVHKDAAAEVALIFRELFRHGFLIERMEPVENFGGSDDRSMEANNTSAFNCRDVTGQPGKFSNHSWGLAIDINPLTNPYVKDQTVLPLPGRAFLDRSRAYPGAVLAGSYSVKLFRSHGWTWGGSWQDRKDYQHFEKPERK